QGTPRTVPGAPQTPAATPGNGELAVTWAAPAADGGDAVATYRLRWKAADETEFADADAATVDAPALTAAITGLSNGRTYDVEIAAGNSAGFGDAATTQGTPRTVPGAQAPSPSVCDRTAQVRAAIVKRVGGGKTCSTVNAQDLAGISGTLDLRYKSITALESGDFNGLVNVTTL
ncbi:MAG: fibronectin type III domain-containing protein, partial [Alphaproteobacteria bacterium]|nr:fibronectin type III domain-containing protein [Alphaproteobacteria bacterium]